MGAKQSKPAAKEEQPQNNALQLRDLGQVKDKINQLSIDSEFPPAGSTRRSISDVDSTRGDDYEDPMVSAAKNNIKRGTAMANALAEKIQMNFFFPDKVSRKAQREAIQRFQLDMQFDLLKGSVKLATTEFKMTKMERKSRRTEPQKLTDLKGCYSDMKQFQVDKPNQRTVLEIFKKFPFMKQDRIANEFSEEEKLFLMSRTRIVDYSPNERIYDKIHDKLDSFNLILEGKIGIFYPDQNKIAKIEDKYSSIVYLTEQEAVNKRLKRQKNNRKKQNTIDKINSQQSAEEKTLDVLKQFSNLVDCDKLKGENPLYNLPQSEFQTMESRQILCRRLTTKVQQEKADLSSDRLHLVNKTKVLVDCVDSPSRRQSSFKNKFTNNFMSPTKSKHSEINLFKKTDEPFDLSVKKDDDFCEKNRRQKALTALTVSLMRDSKDNYNPLERHFGTLSCGMTFGESMLLKEQNTKRFFNAIAFNDVKVLQLDLRDFETMLTKKDRKIQSAKKAFLQEIPELTLLTQQNGLSRPKMINFLNNMSKVEVLKNQYLFKQGEKKKHVWFVVDGDFQVTKNVLNEVKQQQDIVDVKGFIEDPKRHQLQQSKRETVSHVVQFVSRGHILGLDSDFQNTENHDLSVVCCSLLGNLYQMELEYFNKVVYEKKEVMKKLVNSLTKNRFKHICRVKKMDSSNLKIMTSLKIEENQIVRPKGEVKQIDNILQDIAQDRIDRGLDNDKIVLIDQLNCSLTQQSSFDIGTASTSGINVLNEYSQEPIFSIRDKLQNLSMPNDQDNGQKRVLTKQRELNGSVPANSSPATRSPIQVTQSVVLIHSPVGRANQRRTPTSTNQATQQAEPATSMSHHNKYNVVRPKSGNPCTTRNQKLQLATTQVPQSTKMGLTIESPEAQVQQVQKHRGFTHRLQSAQTNFTITNQVPNTKQTINSGSIRQGGSLPTQRSIKAQTQREAAQSQQSQLRSLCAKTITSTVASRWNQQFRQADRLAFPKPVAPQSRQRLRQASHFSQNANQKRQ